MNNSNETVSSESVIDNETSGLSCAKCQSAIPQGEEIATEQAAFCKPCFQEITEEIQAQLAEQGKNINFGGAVAGGLLGGILGALVWWGIVVVAKYQLGLIAILVGWAVGKGVHILSGYKRAVSLQILAVAITAVSYVMASYFVVRTFFQSYAAENNLSGGLPLLPDPGLLFEVVTSGMELWDILFLGIALWQAWKIPAPVSLNTED